jgi:hypothetical protein
MAQINFDARQVEPATEFEPLPAGKYLAVITNSELKPTKAGNGSFLELTFEVIEGQFQSRKLWARLNLENQNALAVKIARAELSALCRSVGVMEPRDSTELHNLPLVITVKQKADADGEIRNEIKAYSKREAANPARPAQAANPTPPWRRG